MTKESRIQSWERRVSLVNAAGKTGQLLVKEWDFNISSHHKKLKISKWIKDLNIRPETIKLLGENLDRKLFDINNSNIFSDLSPKQKKSKQK